MSQTPQSIALPSPGSAQSWMLTSSGAPFPGAVVTVADKLLFCVSTGMTGWPGFWKARTLRSMRRNCASLAVLHRLAAGLQAAAEGTEQPVDRAFADHMAFGAEGVGKAARAPSDVQRSGRSGSPRVVGPR